MEVIDIGLNDLEPISINFDNSAPSSSVNFGPGIELLMNDKNRNAENNIHIDLGELDKLENELNELSGNSNTKTVNTGSGGGESKLLNGFSNFFGFGNKDSDKSASGTNNYEIKTDSKLGSSMKDSMGNTNTWDGFSKMNDIPFESSASSKMSDREKRRKKRLMIKKLEEWYEKGLIKNRSHFDLDSNYDDIEDEYETALEDKRKKDSIKLQGWWFITFVNSIEYANAAFNPFDINLDGWGEQISEDIDSYEEIFTELHDKYKGGKMSPELSLLLRLGFSAAVVNFTNKALSSATPAFNDVIKQSPELMRMFTNATVSSMSQESPGFAFANNLMSQSKPTGTNTRPPPPPVETKNMNTEKSRAGGSTMNFTERPNPTSRPDISMGRGSMFRESGVELNNTYQPINEPSSKPQQPQQPQPQLRPEMRGPQTDIDNILSGLKTRKVDIHQPPNPSQTTYTGGDDDSMISISSLKDNLQNSNIPKKSNRRRQKSERNTISLDI
jgi:hypothetical protein